MQCRIREKFYNCGEYAEVEVYPVWLMTKKKRRPKAKPTPEAQKQLNKLRAERKLARLLNTNFTSDDIQFNLTYAPDKVPSDDSDCNRILTNYLRRLRRVYAKHEIELKYVCVTEKSSRGRYHHHLVINGGVPLSELSAAWGRGHTNAKPLEFDEFGISALAAYMSKAPIGGDRWRASKNLKQPKESQRDGRLSQKKVSQLYDGESEAVAMLLTAYPGWNIADYSSFYNDINKGLYFHIRLYKPKPKQRR